MRKKLFLNVCLAVVMLLICGTMQAANYFVKVDGSGIMDGSSWDNAFDMECFRTAVHDQAIDGDVFYLAGGLYRPDAETTLQADHNNDVTDYFLSIKAKGISLIGGFDPDITGNSTDITYPTATPSVFSGDRNGNGKPDAGDCRVLYIRANANYEKKVTLKGLDITCGYQSNDKDRKPGVSVATGSMVDIMYCNFYNNSNPSTPTTNVAGGSALSVRDHSNVYCYKCVFENNTSGSRGGAIRCEGNTGGDNTLILESCLLTGNSVKAEWGGAMQATTSDVYMINTTITANKTGNNASALNGNARWHFINSTIAGNTGKNSNGIEFRCETNDSYIFNSVIASDSVGVDIIRLETADKGLISGGYNLLSKKGGAGTLTTQTSDVTETSYTAIFGTNTLPVGTGIRTIAPAEDKPGATLAEITAYVDGDTNYWATVKSRLSADWNTKDARGLNRPASGAVTIGAHQHKEAVTSPYFVKVNGSGIMDGSSWDNAFDMERFRTAVDKAVDGDVFYLAGGLYRPNAETVLQLDHTSNRIYFLSIKAKGISLIGGFDPDITGSTTDITYPTATPSVFSGDRNGDGIANDGDCQVLYVRANNDYNKKVTLKGLRITNGYNIGNTDRRPGLSIATGSKVDIMYCTFDNNKNPLTASGNAGGAALCIRDRSNVYCYKCVFENNTSANRGGAIRLDGEGGNTSFPGNTLILESCMLTGNSTTGDWGGAIQVSNGADVYLVNTTVAGNTTGNFGAALNGKVRWHFINSTVAGNFAPKSAGNGFELRCEGYDSYIFNSIIANDSEEDVAIKMETTDFGLVSGGYNLLSKSGGNGTLTSVASDVLETSYSAVFGSNTLAVNDAADGIKTIAPDTDKPGATLAQITAYVDADTYWSEIKSRLSADWNTKDARGVNRPASGAVTIGAYQLSASGGATTIAVPRQTNYLIYPTLLDDILNIETDEYVRISIVNAAGAELYSAYSNGKATVSTASYPKGIYFVNVGGNVTKVLKK